MTAVRMQNGQRFFAALIYPPNVIPIGGFFYIIEGINAGGKKY